MKGKGGSSWGTPSLLLRASISPFPVLEVGEPSVLDALVPSLGGEEGLYDSPFSWVRLDSEELWRKKKKEIKRKISRVVSLNRTMSWADAVPDVVVAVSEVAPLAPAFSLFQCSSSPPQSLLLLFFLWLPCFCIWCQASLWGGSGHSASRTPWILATSWMSDRKKGKKSGRMTTSIYFVDSEEVLLSNRGYGRRCLWKEFPSFSRFVNCFNWSLHDNLFLAWKKKKNKQTSAEIIISPINYPFF